MTAAVAPGPSSSAHRAACLHGRDAAAALDAGWQAACDETPGATVFQTSHWLRTWCDATAALEGVVPLVIRVPASGPLRLGVALQCRNGGDGVRIEPLSSPWADYHDAVGPGTGPDLDAAATALATLARGLGATLAFGDIRPEGLLAALCARLGGQWDPSTPVSQVNLLDGAHLARITERPEHVAKRRRLARKGGLALRRHRTCAAVLAALPRFVTLHERQWHGRGDAVAPFSNPGVTDSFTALAAGLSRHGMLDLTELCHGDLVVAGYYGFIYRRTYYAYRTAFNASYFRFSPGHLMLQALVLSCAADGLATFDLMRGEYAYKAGYASVCGRNLAWTGAAGVA